MSQTLFLKDSVLFISKNGKEYEVSNPEILFIDDKIPEDEQQLFLAHCLLNGTKWPGEVELIKQQRLKSIGAWGSLGHFSIPDSDKNEFEFRTVARLLPKEKKENKIGIASHGPISTQAESDYQQFEGKNLHIVTPESSEPQEKRTESDMVHCGGINCPFEYSCVDGCMYPKPIISAPVESQEEQNTVEGWISLELQAPKPMQWVLVWIEERKMSFMACRRAYPDEQSYSMWDSPFDEVTIYNGEIYYWKPMPNFTLTRLTP